MVMGKIVNKVILFWFSDFLNLFPAKTNQTILNIYQLPQQQIIIMLFWGGDIFTQKWAIIYLNWKIIHTIVYPSF